MKVKDLILALQGCNPESEVCIPYDSDPSYFPMSDLEAHVNRNPELNLPEEIWLTS